MASKNVVIVGGGSAGKSPITTRVELAATLSSKLASTQHTLTLVSDKDYYPHYISSLRTLSAPVEDKELFDRSFFSLERLFAKGNGKGKVVFGRAISIEYDADGASNGTAGTESKKVNLKSGKVVTDKGESVPFDILAVATGSKMEPILSFKATKTETLQHVTEWREKIKNAKGIVVVGGGAVGMELSGEIREQHPKKPITIVHNQSLLLNARYPDKFRRDLATRLAKRDIRVILDDSINVEEQAQREASAEIVTEKKVKIENADLLIATRGSTPNPTIFETLSPKPITESNHIDVVATLQVKEHSSIFALGDIISWDNEIPQKTKHARQAGVVCKNILDLLNGREPATKHTAMPEGIVVTLGKSHGAGYVDLLWGIKLGDWLSSKAKGRELFVPYIQKLLNYQNA